MSDLIPKLFKSRITEHTGWIVREGLVLPISQKNWPASSAGISIWFQIKIKILAGYPNTHTFHISLASQNPHLPFKRAGFDKKISRRV